MAAMSTGSISLFEGIALPTAPRRAHSTPLNEHRVRLGTSVCHHSGNRDQSGLGGTRNEWAGLQQMYGKSSKWKQLFRTSPVFECRIFDLTFYFKGKMMPNPPRRAATTFVLLSSNFRKNFLGIC